MSDEGPRNGYREEVSSAHLPQAHDWHVDRLIVMEQKEDGVHVKGILMAT